MAEKIYIQEASEIFKEMYLPAMRNTVQTEASFLNSKIWANNKGYDGSDEIVTAMPIGVSGGAGFGASYGEDAPRGANKMHRKYRTDPKEFGVTVELLDRLVRGGKGKEALIDYMATEIEGSTETGKWNMARVVWGNGKGVLANVKGAVTNSATIVVDEARNLLEGLLVDIYPSGDEVDSAPTYEEVRILGIDFSDETSVKVTLSEKVTVASGAFITLQKSYGNEFTGVDALFDDEIDEIGKIKKNENPWIKPLVHDANNDVTFEVIRKALRASDKRNGKIDVIACGSGAFDNFAQYLMATDQKLRENDALVGGFKTMSFLHGTREIAIYEEPFVKSSEMIGVATEDIVPYVSELDYTTEAPDAPAFARIPGKKVYQALLMSYGDIVYRNSGSFFKIKNAAAK